MLEEMPTSNCSLTNTDCICHDKNFQDRVGGCMLAKCTMQESLDTSRVQAAICHLPNTSKRKRVLILTIVVYAVCFLFVAARTVGKVVAKRLTLDDYFVVGTFLLAAFPLGCVLKSTSMTNLASESQVC